MTKAETIALQRDLYRLGYYSGPIDGIYGPLTEAAYSIYWDNHSTETQVPFVAPAPATPWWTSRGIWGSLLTLAAVGAGFAGHGFDAQEATDAIMPIVELIPLFMGAVGGLLAWWGRKNAKAPIDPTLVLPGVRLPSRVHDKPLPTRSSAKPRDPFGHFGS